MFDLCFLEKSLPHWCYLSNICKALNPGLQIPEKTLRFYIFNFIHMLGSILTFLYSICKLWSTLHCSSKREIWRWRAIYGRPHLDKEIFIFDVFTSQREWKKNVRVGGNVGCWVANAWTQIWTTVNTLRGCCLEPGGNKQQSVQRSEWNKHFKNSWYIFNIRTIYLTRRSIPHTKQSAER